MKKLIILSLMAVLVAASAASAQTPAPEPDTVSNPVQQGDPAVKQLPPRLDYIEDRKRITAEELPEPVQQTLESSAQYKDWQRAVIFRDDNKDEYVVEFTEAGRTTSYRFNKEGKPIVEE